MKPLKNNFLRSYGYKVLVASMTALSTVLVTTSVTQASDIDIYQDAKSGDVTLMFMLDVSGSMTGSGSYDGTGQYRITRLKTAMNDLLNGNASKGITKLADDKIIGLSTLGSPTNTESGAVLVPARRLNTTIVVQECTGSWWNTQCKDVNKTQREILWERINGLSANSNTPTGRSYATTISYLMGTSTKNYTDGGWGESDELTKSGNNY